MWCSVEHSLRDSNLAYISMWVAASVKGFGHISCTERYILEIPLPFNNQPHLKTHIKIYQEALAKHSQALHLALVLFSFAYILSKALQYICFSYHDCFTFNLQLSCDWLSLILFASIYWLFYCKFLHQKTPKNTHPHHTSK